MSSQPAAARRPVRSKRPPPAEFARTADLLRCLGDHINDRRLLYNLCLASKRFCSVFTPFLYAEVAIDTRWASLRRLGRDEYAPRLAHTRRLSCIFKGNPPVDWRRVNAKVQRLIVKMKKLECLQWSGLWLDPETLQLVRDSCPLLSDIDVSYPTRTFEDWSRANETAVSPAPGLINLTNLRSLSLINVDISTSLERSGLPATLANNPGIQSLALSASESSLPAVCMAYRNHAWCTHLFNTMSDRYSKLGGAPLPIRSLHLGLGFVPQNKAFGTARLTAETALKLLADISVLRELHIDNRCMRARQRRQGVYIRSTEKVYDLISATSMPRLRRLSVFKEDNEFLHWWRRKAEGDFLRRLSISFVIPPRMELVDETISNWCGSLSEDILADLHQVPRMLDISLAAYQWKREDVMATKLHILQELVASGRHVEGLFIWLSEDWMDVLKNGNGGGTLFGRILSCLARLPKLSQLALGTKVPGLDTNPGSTAQRREFAQRLAEKLPTVRYLMMFPDAWWISHERELVSLTRKEIRTVELFRSPVKPTPDIVAPEFWHQDLRSMWLGNHVDGDLVLDKT